MARGAKQTTDSNEQIARYKEQALVWELRADKEPKDIIGGPLKKALDVASRSENEVEYQILSGWIKFYKRDFESAFLRFEKGLKLPSIPRDKKAELLGWKSRALIYLCRPIESLEAADEAVELNPKDSLLHFRRGGALLRQARYEEAIRAFRVARESDLIAIPAGLDLACAQYYADRLAASLETLTATEEAVVDLGLPPYPPLMNNKGVFYHVLADGTGDEAKDQDAGWLYWKATQVRDKFPEAFYNYGLFCLREFDRSSKKTSEWLKKAESYFANALEQFKSLNQEPMGL